MKMGWRSNMATIWDSCGLTKGNDPEQDLVFINKVDEDKIIDAIWNMHLIKARAPG